MTMIAGHHTRDDEPGHGEQSLDVGVDHRFPVVLVTLVFLFKAECKSSVVDEHVYLVPLLGQRRYSIMCGLTVAHVKDERQHLGSTCFEFCF